MTQRAAVIGAGLAGAATAHQLALLGWQVDVYEQAPRPAARASGLPVALFCPNPSADDNIQSRFIRAGLKVAVQDFAAHLQKGRDWQLSGVLEGFNSAKRLAACREQAAGSPTMAAYTTVSEDRDGFLHHHLAGWVKPACLVQAWLAHPNIRIFLDHCVARSHDQANCLAMEEDYQAVVYCTSYQTPALCSNPVRAKLPLMRPIRGQVTLGSMRDWQGPFPDMPINGQGHIVGRVPANTSDQTPFWAIGSSFVRDCESTTQRPQEDSDNVDKLSRMLPDEAHQARQIILAGQQWSWAGVRCYLPDRFPLVGHLEDKHYLLAGLGSRGLSTVGLCARVLAHRIHAGLFEAPKGVDVEHDVLTKIDVNRYK